MTLRQPYWCPKTITSPVGVELFSSVNSFFCSNKFAWLLATFYEIAMCTSEYIRTKTKLSIGNGSYMYIETSHPHKYNKQAKLNSPWTRGAQQMTFSYSMHGSTVESLSVYIRINGSEERIWSRHGNHLSSCWTKGCVSINGLGTYQVEIIPY